MKLISFDLEIAKLIPDDAEGWADLDNLGISCAAIASSDGATIMYPRPKLDEGDGMLYDLVMNEDYSTELTPIALKDFVSELQSFTDQGYMIVTVNGAGFDLKLLAEESGMAAECADLMLNHHCDLMLMSVCKLGWPTGLDALAKGAGVESKLKSVALSDGTVLEGMSGSKAPEMWKDGEYKAVMAYLHQDVKATLETAQKAVERRSLVWQSSSGKTWRVLLPTGEDGTCRLPTVAEMLHWPAPDTSWMENPLDPQQMTAWAREAL